LFYTLIIPALFAWFVTPLTLHASERPLHKRILLLNSYHADFKGSDDIVSGFKETMHGLIPDAEIKIEYLDSKNNSGSEYDHNLLNLMQLKYNNKQFELVVTIDDYAFNIIEKNRDGLFGSSPVVFCGTNNFNFERIKDRPDFAGFNELPSFGETLELIFKLHPDTKKLIAIYDDSVTGKNSSDIFREAASKYSPRIEFLYREGRQVEDIISEVGAHSQNTVVIYFASFMLNTKGERLSSIDALRKISFASKVPIYGGWEFNLGHGIVGGKLIDLKEHGHAAAKLSAKLLRGEVLSVPDHFTQVQTPSCLTILNCSVSRLQSQTFQMEA
jgi:two-component system, sensor histidine kinase